MILRKWKKFNIVLEFEKINIISSSKIENANVLKPKKDSPYTTLTLFYHHG